MGFEFRGSFATNTPRQAVANPLDTVAYTDDLERDSLAELDALRRAMLAAPASADLVVVFPERDSLERFMSRHHLGTGSRFVDAAKFNRSMRAKPRGGGFAVGGFSMKPASDAGTGAPAADEGWLRRVASERDRFKLATDPEYYFIVSFASQAELSDSLAQLGLGDLPRLPVEGVVALSGPGVESIVN